MRNLLLICTLISCCLLPACTEIIFTQKAKGRIPSELVGDYYLEFEEKGEQVVVFFHIEEIRAGFFEFQFLEADNEEPIQVEIVARGNDYFLNWPVEEDGEEDKWHISSFRWNGDSAYHLLEALTWESMDDFPVEKYFKNYKKKVESEDHTVYRVDNRRRETVKAFRDYHDQMEAKGGAVVLQKIDVPQVTEAEVVEGNRMRVGPNPFEDQLRIKFYPAARGTLNLLDLRGNVVATTGFSGHEIYWTLEGLRPGVYFLQRVNNDDQIIETVRVVKNE